MTQKILDVNQLMVDIDKLSDEFLEICTKLSKLRKRLKELFEARGNDEWRATCQDEQASELKLKEISVTIRNKKHAANTIINALDNKRYEKQGRKEE